jgi:hypothetical protein
MIAAGYCFTDMIELLLSQGIENAEYRRIWHAISTNQVDRPPLDGSNRFRFQTKHIRQIKRYLASGPKPGRRAIEK